MTRKRKRRRPAHRKHSFIAIGQRVHRGRGKKREEGVIIGWSRDARRRLVWIIG